MSLELEKCHKTWPFYYRSSVAKLASRGMPHKTSLYRTTVQNQKVVQPTPSGCKHPASVLASISIETTCIICVVRFPLKHHTQHCLDHPQGQALTNVSDVVRTVTWPGNAPFPGARETETRVSLADSEGASHSGSIQMREALMSIQELRVHEMEERPLVTINVNGKTALCFIDTGWQTMLIKPRAPKETHCHDSYP